jgi:hypothetical protein
MNPDSCLNEQGLESGRIVTGKKDLAGRFDILSERGQNFLKN